MTALETRALRFSYGGVAATAGVDFALPPGARHALIGPNGAGKTTFVNLLAGTIRPDAGRILMDGREITAAPPHQRARLGLSRSFQINQLFPTLTAAESVALAVRERSGRAPAAEVAAQTRALLDHFALSETAAIPAAQLAYGQQRLLELAIAMAGRPRVLLLDEPAAGLSEGERRELLATLTALPRETAVLMIEHDMDLVFAFADRIHVMAEGAILTEGTPAKIAADPRVREVYLGTRDG